MSILKKRIKNLKERKESSNFCIEFFSDYFFSFFLLEKYSQNDFVQALCFFFVFFLLFVFCFLFFVFCFLFFVFLKCLNKLLTLFGPELLLENSLRQMNLSLKEETLFHIAISLLNPHHIKV